MSAQHVQHVVPRGTTRLRSILDKTEEWTPREAWQNLIICGAIVYIFCGVLTFWVARDGADVPTIERIFHPIHWLIRWGIESMR